MSKKPPGATPAQIVNSRRPGGVDDIARLMLDSIPFSTVVIDQEGVIAGVNQAWQDFALTNGVETGKPVKGTDVGDNYFAACKRSTFFQNDDSIKLSEAIKQVLYGRSGGFSYEYPCHSPKQKRWFNMIVLPLETDPRSVVISHIDITENKDKETALRKNSCQVIKFK